MFMESMCDLVGAYVADLSEEELKGFTKKDLAGFTKSIDFILREGLQRRQPSEHVETIRLQVALRWLKSPILEKRVNGILEIKVLHCISCSFSLCV